jgi:(S)-ureidoglycine aminohydrolase
MNRIEYFSECASMEISLDRGEHRWRRVPAGGRSRRDHMRQQNQLLGSRARVKDRYALIPLEGIPFSRLPEWPEAQVQILAAPSLGADFAQYRITMGPKTRGDHPVDGEAEHFLFVLTGEAELLIQNYLPEDDPEDEPEDERKDGPTGASTETAASVSSHSLTPGGYALIPPSAGYRLTATTEVTLLLLRKLYEPAPGVPLFDPIVGNENEVNGEVYLGDEGAHLQTLIPDEFAFDMAMNIFTFETGHSLPVTETHVMEHGLYVLEGKGLYYLDDTWMEVEVDDFIWMGPFCPQSYYATGPSPTRYLYYKNVNREIEL